MDNEQEAVGMADRLTVEVADPTRHQQVTFDQVRPTANVKDIVTMAMSSLRLTPNISWDLRDEKTSRLLPRNQPIGDVAGETAPHLRVTMQPDAGLA